MKKAMVLTGLVFFALGVVGVGVNALRTHLTGSLAVAARTGDVARTSSLLRWRWLADISHRSVLRGAAEAGHTDVVALLLDAGVYPSAGALERAADEGHIETVALLIEAGADASVADLDGAAEAGHTEVVALLIEEGADLSSEWPLIEAAQEGHTDIVALLIQAGAEINRCSSNRNGVSRVEAAIGNTLNRIVGSPHRMEAREHSGPLFDVQCYPLSLERAIEAGHTEIAGMLIAAGANVLAKNYLAMGRTPVELAHEEGQADMIQLLDAALELPLAGNVINAAEARDWDRLSRVVALGADVNEPETWSFGTTFAWTALMYAAYEGRVDIVSTLLDAGADVTHATADSVTALSLATKNGHEAVVERLRAASAQR